MVVFISGSITKAGVLILAWIVEYIGLSVIKRTHTSRILLLLLNLFYFLFEGDAALPVLNQSVIYVGTVVISNTMLAVGNPGAWASLRLLLSSQTRDVLIDLCLWESTWGGVIPKGREIILTRGARQSRFLCTIEVNPWIIILIVGAKACSQLIAITTHGCKRCTRPIPSNAESLSVIVTMSNITSI